jgi:hypothetical protein
VTVRLPHHVVNYLLARDPGYAPGTIARRARHRSLAHTELIALQGGCAETGTIVQGQTGNGSQIFVFEFAVVSADTIRVASSTRAGGSPAPLTRRRSLHAGRRRTDRHPAPSAAAGRSQPPHLAATVQQAARRAGPAAEVGGSGTGGAKAEDGRRQAERRLSRRIRTPLRSSCTQELCSVCCSPTKLQRFGTDH